MVIHFVCFGNRYRSRLAEAYLNSLGLRGIKVMSSGVHAAGVDYPAISPWTVKVLGQQHLTGKKHWDQLTQDRLDQSDVVICMNRRIYHEARQKFKLPLTTIVWDIPDVNEVFRNEPEKLANDQLVGDLATRTYAKIVARVDELLMLIKHLKHLSPVDALNSHGELIGPKPLGEVLQRGLWHQGVHVAAYTADGKVLLQHRAPSMVFNPNLWEMSYGGAIDVGEAPELAAVREGKEELGLDLRPSHLQQIADWRYDHYWQHYGFHNRLMLRSYLVEIPDHVAFKFQPGESDAAKLVSIAEARELIAQANTRLRLVNYPSYHHRILDAIQSRVKQPTI